jgi:hypothetical protein
VNTYLLETPVARLRTLVLATPALLLLAACGGSGAPVAHASYELHSTFFSSESGLTSAIDPQVFTASPGAAAGTGPQGIVHAAGYAAARESEPASSGLFAADGTPLHLTLGAWNAAKGTLALSCASGREKVASTLTGLVPSGVYSVFDVHLLVNGAGRFTPLGDPTGIDNTFTATSRGTASSTNTVAGCLAHMTDAVVVIWHSDGQAHGATPGTLGITWHNAVIAQVPA